MSTIDTKSAASAMVGFLTGGTVTAADAANAVRQVTSTNDSTDKIIGAAGAGADIIGIGTSSTQMLQQFAANSSEAGALAGGLAKTSAISAW